MVRFKQHKNILYFVRILIAVLSLIILIGIVFQTNNDLFASDNEKTEFRGKGTKRSPYLISGVEDLCAFRDAVNSGSSFTGKYFLQTCDLDLESESPWIPIGIFSSNKYFFGTYDGGNNKIFNIDCYSENSSSANIGFFGQLGGTVQNLGIESGSINGAYVGSIASHSTGDSAAIINCYNRANVHGSGRAGGICDNFSGGIVVNCANYGDVSGEHCAQIVSYNAGQLINVFPADNAFSSDFNGSFSNYTNEDMSDVNILLNRGIDYLNKSKAFKDYAIKKWEK